MREFIWLDAMPLVMVNGPPASPTYTWITTGHLDEPLLLTDAAGAVVSSVTRDPWGNRVLLAGGDPLDLGYPGQWRDGASGLFQNHHRDYDPMTGRYIEADPLGLGGGSNLYAYVGGDPINAVDPEGLCIWDSCIAEGIVLGALIGSLIDLDMQLWQNGGRFDCVDWSSVGWSAAIGGVSGGIGGIGSVAGRGLEFSHAVPGRFVRPLTASGKNPNPYFKPWLKKALPDAFWKSRWNGNYVSPRFHALTDHYRKLKGMTKAETIVAPLRYFIRIPTIYAYPVGGVAIGVNVSGHGE